VRLGAPPIPLLRTLCTVHASDNSCFNFPMASRWRGTVALVVCWSWDERCFRFCFKLCHANTQNSCACENENSQEVADAHKSTLNGTCLATRDSPGSGAGCEDRGGMPRATQRQRIVVCDCKDCVDIATQPDLYDWEPAAKQLPPPRSLLVVLEGFNTGPTHGSGAVCSLDQHYLPHFDSVARRGVNFCLARPSGAPSDLRRPAWLPYTTCLPPAGQM
jgi:hypothetical protein